MYTAAIMIGEYLAVGLFILIALAKHSGGLMWRGMIAKLAIAFVIAAWPLIVWENFYIARRGGELRWPGKV